MGWRVLPDSLRSEPWRTLHTRSRIRTRLLGTASPCDGLTDLRRMQQIDSLPGRKLRDFQRRRGMVRPPDDILAPAQRLDDVAAGKTGGACYENDTVHPSMFSVLCSCSLSGSVRILRSVQR